MPLAERLGVPVEQVSRVDLLQVPALPEPEKLISAAFERGPSDPEAAQVLLASAMLAQAQRTAEGRMSATLSLLARLVAHADPRRTLGPEGATIRHEIMPNGWRYTLASWPRLRYAWREGMRDLLQPSEANLGIADAIDEVTRMNEAEPEPVSVAITETWPQPRIAFAVTAAGLAIAGYTMYRQLAADRALDARLTRRTRRR